MTEFEVPEMKYGVSNYPGKGEEIEDCMSEPGESEVEDEEWQSNLRPVDYYELRFSDSIINDRKDVLVEMLKVIRDEQLEADDPLHSIFYCDSANCLEAVLNGETAGLLDINDVNAAPFTSYNPQLVPILHKAARYGAPRITNLCLPGNEAQLNLRIDVDGMKGVLPLNLALQNLRLIMEDRDFCPPHNKKSKSMLTVLEPQWITEPSPEEPQRLVFKLIYNLCARSGKMCAAKVVRLLASKTIEVEEEFFKYVKERKLPELTALLMLAHERLEPCLKGNSIIRDFVLKEIASLRIIIFTSSYDVDGEKLMYEVKKRKMEMEAVMLVLEIFNRFGDKIAAYLQRSNYYKGSDELDKVREVSELLKEAGFDAELELLDEIRDRCKTDIFGIMADTPTNNRDMESNIGLTNIALGEAHEKLNSYLRAYRTGIVNNETNKSWLVNKQDILARLKSSTTFHITHRSYHRCHFVRGCHSFGSTTANKVDLFHHTDHFVGVSGVLGSTMADKVYGMVSRLQLKKQYQDSGKSAQVTSMSSWQSYLQFSYVLSANSSRQILHITRKLGRAL